MQQIILVFSLLLFSSSLWAQSGRVGIGTTTPLSQLHIHDAYNENNIIYVTPLADIQGDSSTIFLAEDDDATFGMYWMYDGQGNKIELWGKNSLGHQGPHLIVQRDNGYTTINGKLELSDGINPFIIPNNDGNNGQVLKTNGSGILSWTSDNVNDSDASPTNEIQTLSITDQDLSISSGNTITLPVGKWTETSGNPDDIYYSGGKVGIGTTILSTEFNVYSDGNTGKFTTVGISSGHKKALEVTASNSSYVTALDSIVGIRTSASGSQGKNIALLAQTHDSGDHAAVFDGRVQLGSSHTSHNQVMITPQNVSAEDSTSIFLGEDHDGSYGMYWLYDGEENEMELWGKSTNSTFGPHMIVERNSGNMSIGNTKASAHRLSVDGKIACEELRVEDSGDWPDYVFDKDYNLHTLSALEKYIEENNHLPDIPSAETINGNGFDTGDMIERLLRKVEELTLYTIKQQREIDELRLHLNKEK